MTAGRALLGEEAAISLARVMGSATARVAQAVVDAFRVQFETRQLAAGAPYSDVVEQYVSVARVALPGFVDALGDVFLRHLLAVAASAWSPDAEGSTASRDTVVGFVDVVGYTVLSQTIRPAELARLIDDFENLVAEKVGAGGGKVVKLIGDAAIFIADDPANACRVALDIVAGADDAGLPRLRAGLAAGDVISLHGDVFGDVVNLAARLVAVAPEHRVLADGEVRRRAEATVTFTPLPPQHLKGFGAPARPTSWDNPTPQSALVHSAASNRSCASRSWPNGRARPSATCAPTRIAACCHRPAAPGGWRSTARCIWPDCG